MKDQQRLVRKCLDHDIPVFVLCGTDRLSVETLRGYAFLAERRGCTHEFLTDLQRLVADFEQFQREESEKVKLPD